MGITESYHIFCMISLGVLVLLAAACLVRCVIGPRVSDRILGVNMVGTLVIIMAAIFTVAMKEGYLADISLVYALISFVSVVLLCKIYTGIYRERKHEEARQKGENGDSPVDEEEAEEKAEEKAEALAEAEEKAAEEAGEKEAQR